VNKDGEAIGVVTHMFTDAADAGRTFFVGPDSLTARKLLSSTSKFGVDDVAREITHTRQWNIEDGDAAAESLAKYWGRSDWSQPGSLGIHTSFGRYVSGDDALHLRATFNELDRTITVRPTDLNGWGLTDQTYQDTVLKDAELVVQLDQEMKPTKLIVNNDPSEVLQRWLHEPLPFIPKPAK
jgi:hypothetical protein